MCIKYTNKNGLLTAAAKSDCPLNGSNANRTAKNTFYVSTLDVSKNLVVGSDFFTTLGSEFGHLMGTTWSSET